MARHSRVTTCFGTIKQKPMWKDGIKDLWVVTSIYLSLHYSNLLATTYSIYLLQAKGKSAKKSTIKFVIDCTAPVDDKVLDIASFEKYLNERIKVEGKTSNLAQCNVVISRDRTKITVASPTDLGFSKRQLKYLSKRYLKKQQLRDYLRVIASSKNSYELKYYQITAGDEGEDEE
eukprot:CAMPEP_0201872774 /NCGR_PEP_ID=MMETSP0902-20130614/5409_1 /ASSEMBLY_ACC=CAM_ASM_000551 /TAXON_ID=420261 /ORGANISM="Thalassiosira antarctica, Strain CCMP982" /LENGTH=174 /DNA_ID=CAMNT_0048399159 /DNA_START=167 /DNA_END=692 /DNA_ORIENTATION=-